MRALEASRIPTYLGAPDRDIATRSRLATRFPAALAAGDPSGLLDAFERVGVTDAVLYPCNDHWLATVAGLPRSSGRGPVAPMANEAVIGLLLDKLELARTLAHLDVPHPVTIELAGPEDLDGVDDDVVVGGFIKPCDSQGFAATFGTKGFVVASRDEAKRRVGDATRAGHSVVLQELIRCRPTGHVFLDGFVGRAGDFSGLYARRRLRMHPAVIGNSTASVTIPLEEVAPAVESLRRLFEGIGYHGLFDAEFALDSRDGVFRLIEVNARAWWQIGLARRCGVDVVRMAYDDALELPVVPVDDYRTGVRWIHTIPDARARWADRHTPGRARGGWYDAEHPVVRLSDPGPAVAELIQRSEAAIRRRLRHRRA